MTELMLDTAKEEFLKNNFKDAYRWALSAKLVDPFFDSVDRYVEVYRIHYDHSHRRTKTGEIDWYGVLNIRDELLCCQSITHRYVKIGKMIDPDEFNCVAAPGAMKLITTAWEIVGEAKNRRNYHVRAGFKPLESSDYWPKPPQMKQKSSVAVEQWRNHHGNALSIGF